MNFYAAGHGFHIGDVAMNHNINRSSQHYLLYAIDIRDVILNRNGSPSYRRITNGYCALVNKVSTKLICHLNTPS